MDLLGAGMTELKCALGVKGRVEDDGAMEMDVDKWKAPSGNNFNVRRKP